MRPTEEMIGLLGPVPDDLAGFQHLERGTINYGDLICHDLGGGDTVRNWAWWACGKPVELCRGRVYRRLKVFSQGSIDLESAPT